MAEICIQAPHFKKPVKIEVAAIKKLPFGVSILLGNQMFQDKAQIKDVVTWNVDNTSISDVGLHNDRTDPDQSTDTLALMIQTDLCRLR